MNDFKITGQTALPGVYVAAQPHHPVFQHLATIRFNPPILCTSEPPMKDDTVSLRRDHRGEENFILSVGAAEIVLTALHIVDNSNFVYPHRVMGKGGACIVLTDRQVARLIAEWMRMTLHTDFGYHCQEDTSFKFYAERKKRS